MIIKLYKKGISEPNLSLLPQGETRIDSFDNIFIADKDWKVLVTESKNNYTALENAINKLYRLHKSTEQYNNAVMFISQYNKK